MPVIAIGILVVEDDPDTRELQVQLIEGQGTAVTVALSAEEDLTRMRDGGLDLTISDIGLPGTDSYDLVQHIPPLAPQAGGPIPAIALTAYARGEDRRERSARSTKPTWRNRWRRGS